MLTVIKGDQIIRIYDRNNFWDENPALIFEGESYKLHSTKSGLANGYNLFKVKRSQVHGMDVAEDGAICFTLQTNHEEY